MILPIISGVGLLIFLSLVILFFKIVCLKLLQYFLSLFVSICTVSVVGVLQRKRVDPHLFSLVFGESALNDAVALVLFKTLADFLRQNAMQNYDNDNNTDLYKNVGKYLLDLLVQCVVSPILGLVFASLMGLAFKHGRMRDHKLLELSLYIMPVYIPFMLSELLELSGMITIFFTGIFARRYMEPNVSEETREYARIIFRLLAFLAEVCIFLELGLSVCGMHKGHFSWPFVSWAFVAALLGRAIGVYPLSFLYNLSLTRPMDNTANKTVAVEMMSNKSIDDPENKSSKKDVIVDIEAPTPTRDYNSTKEDFNLFDDDIIEKGGNRIPDILPTTSSSPERACEASVGDDSTASSNTSSNTSSANTSVMSTSFYQLMPTVVSKRETPERKRDKIIPVKFMHLLWFAGLRGAVAYACAREFPDVYGHRDEFIAATMVIVVITIVLMGGATEPLMDRLGIRINVDNDEYMRAWHQQRKLKGKLLHFGTYVYIYIFTFCFVLLR
jgi:NhaP-type Na+/H+ or K+/H+ antiporter